MKVNNFYKALFLVFVILGVYYPAIFGGTLLIDDLKMMAKLEHSASKGLLNLLIPGSGFYYRPLLILTYFLDKVLWQFEPGFMHLENIIIHTINTLLVFFLAKIIFKKQTYQKYELPLLAALLFGIHPINTESINWISGRTDPLATSFMLMALISLIRGIEKEKTIYIALASLLMIVGAMCKEMTIFIVPAAAIIILFWRVPEKERNSITHRVKQCLILFSPIMTGLIIYGISRWTKHQEHDLGLNWLLSRDFDLLNTARISIKVFGFYVKKLFLPLPLNFTIVSISNAYLLVGFGALAGVYGLSKFRSNSALLLIASAVMIIPAILITLFGVAWTPLAERYLYLPSVFFCIGITGLLFECAAARNAARPALMIMVLCLVPATVATAQRNIIWQDQLALYKDSKKKSPDFKKINNEIAISLLYRGKLDAAEQYIKENKNSFQSDEKVALNLASIYLKKDDIQKAQDVVGKALHDKKDSSINLLKMWAVINEKIIFKTGVKRDNIDDFTELIDTYKAIYERTHEPYQLYRAGQLSLAINNKKAASYFFSRAASEADESAFYKKAAVKIAAKLKDE